MATWPPDLPDYWKRIQNKTDHWWIKGELFKDPTISNALPISIENPAIAYDSIVDRFKIRVEEWTAGALDVNVTNWTPTQLVNVNLQQVLGADLSHTNPLIIRISDGVDAFIDPREIRTLTSADTVTVQQPTAANLQATVTQAEKDRTITNLAKAGTITPIDVSATAAGNNAIWTPATGKAIQLGTVQYESDADVEVGLKFGTTGALFARRTTKGVMAITFIVYLPKGATDEVLYLYVGGAVNVKGFVIGEEVS